MSSIYAAIPGMESYMTDETSVDVDVDVKEPEEVTEEVTEAADQAEEATEVEAESEDNEEQVEMVCRSFDELDRMEAHMQKYGVTREWVDWIGESRLAAVCGVTIPSMESIDTTSDPNSQFSLACMEGIGSTIAEGARAVWEFIKKVCRTVISFLKRAFDFVTNFIIGTKRNAERLKKVWGTRQDDPKRAGEAEASFATLGELEQLKTAAGGKVVEKAFEVDGACKKFFLAVFTLGTVKSTDGTIDNAGSRQKLEEFTKMVASADSIIKGKLKADGGAKKRKVSDCGWNDVPKLCDLAIQMTTDADKMKKLVETVRKETEEYNKNAEKKAKEAADPDRAKQKAASQAGREAAKQLSTMTKNLMKVLNFQNKIARQAVKTASVRISSGSSKKGGGESK